MFVTLQEVMKGNNDGRSVVKHTFSSPMYARYVRLYPTAYSHGGFCLRMELYGCSNCKLLICKFSLSFFDQMSNKFA